MLAGVSRSVFIDHEKRGSAAEPDRFPIDASEVSAHCRPCVDDRVRLQPTSSGRDAISLALEGIRPDGEVWITSSVGSPLWHLSPCVMQAVSRRARFAEHPTARTVAVILVHEWGFPHRERSRILSLASAHGWRVIDDCAHAFAYGLRLAAEGATVVFSLPKLLPVRGGGFLASRSVFASAHAMTPSEDLLRAVRIRSAAHVANWRRIDALAAALGLSSVDVLSDDVVPQVYRLKARHQFAAQKILHDLGIETTPPFYTGWLALPCHSDLPHAYWPTLQAAFERLRRRS